MRTTINAQPAEWPAEVQQLWREKVDTDEFRAELAKDKTTVSMANYFTPRPYKNEYDQGSNKEGFVFVIGQKVYIAEWFTAGMGRAHAHS